MTKTNHDPERRKTRAGNGSEQQASEEDMFIEAISAGATPEEGALALGYAPSCAETVGYRLKKKLHDRIVARQIERLQRGAIHASKELVRLALHADQEAVRLKACISVLDRALGKPTDHIVQETTTTMKTEEQSTADLEQELADLLKGTEFADGLSNVVALPGTDPNDVLLEADRLKRDAEQEDDDETN